MRSITVLYSFPYSQHTSASGKCPVQRSMSALERTNGVQLCDLTVWLHNIVMLKPLGLLTDSPLQ